MQSLHRPGLSARAPSGARQRAAAALRSPPARASSSGAGVVDRAQPEWTGDALTSKLVNALINTPPIWAVMKFFAKLAIKNTAAKKGIDWDGYKDELLANTQELERLRTALDQGLSYPDYYLKPFHTYDTGNLEWLAAAEVKPASTVIACRTFKDMGDAAAAEARLRRQINGCIRSNLQQRGLPDPATILDAGCSVGVSSRWLADEFPCASITGLDASPYFLAVAEYEQRRDPLPCGRSVTYVHGLAEATGFPDASLDMVAFNFVAHECPDYALRDFMAEALRILKPGGTLVFVDNNPCSETIQKLPPAIFTLMKSTEPWSDVYYSFDMEAALAAAGFEGVYTAEADHRHRAVFGAKPRT